MNDKEIFNLLNNIDEDLIDEKINEIMKEKGESINIINIKEKAMSKLNDTKMKKPKNNKKIIIVAAIIATLSISTIYASDISEIVQSFFNKSVIYSTVVDGTAYYLPEKIKLNDDITVLNTSISEGNLEMEILSNRKLTDEEIESFDISITPSNNEKTNYIVSGYMYDKDVITLLFMNGIENNYNIVPFKDFILEFDNNIFDISLKQANNLVTNDNFVIAESKTDIDIVNIAGKKDFNNNLLNIQLIAGFNDPNLKLDTFGTSTLTEFTYYFENNENGTLHQSSNFNELPIKAYNNNNEIYILNKPKDAVGRPVTIFETVAKSDENLSIEIPSIIARYEKEISNLNIIIPEKGKVELDEDLDFIIQKLKVKSIERISEDFAVVEFELNTDDNKNVSIIDIGAYCGNSINATTTIKENRAKMVLKFDKDTKALDLSFSYPNFIIQGDWIMELSNDK